MRETRAKEPSAGMDLRAEEREKEVRANKLKKSNSLVPFPSLLAEEEEGIYEELKPDDLIFYNVKDVARMLRCSLPTAREIMHRPDFPLVGTSRQWRVCKSAFEQWAQKRRAEGF